MVQRRSTERRRNLEPPDPEAASDDGTYVNVEPEDLEDEGYEALEADAGDEDEIREEADELAIVNANEPLDEEVEDADPTHLLIETNTGNTIEEDIEIPPPSELEPPENADEPLQRPPDELEPETGGHLYSDIDIEGDWPGEEN